MTNEIQWSEPMTGPEVKALNLPGDMPIECDGTIASLASYSLRLDFPVYRIPINQTTEYNHYSALLDILDEAYEQAASGKGKERHANGKPWSMQPICEIGRMVGVGFNTGQAIKKLQESSRMKPDAAIRELLGAIVYAASAAYLIREGNNVE